MRERVLVRGPVGAVAWGAAATAGAVLMGAISLILLPWSLWRQLPRAERTGRATERHAVWPADMAAPPLGMLGQGPRRG
jgi:hypothetical protein